MNESASKTCGYTVSELLQMSIFDLNPSEKRSGWPKHWATVKERKKISFETKHRHKDGFLYDIEITNNFIEFDGQEFSCSIVRDIRKKKLEEELLRTISEATSGLVGQDFFEALTRYVTLSLGIKTCIVTECTDIEKTRVRTLSYSKNKKT